MVTAIGKGWNMSRRKIFQVLVAAMVTVCLLVLSGVSSAQGNSDNAFEHVKAVQERHTEELVAKPGVAGTAVGLNDENQQAVLVLLEKPGVAGIPQDLEGVPVHPVVTGKIEALKAPGPPSASSINPKAYFTRPVPIGVSTGNATAKDLATGTISCRVKSGALVYALSNNHVYALENLAPLGSEVLQPGLYDGGISVTDHLGNLSVYVPIVFSASALNTVDAAIALTTTSLLGKATPANGYGTPSSTTQAAKVNQAVQKYGRTTSLTKGTVTGINATILVGYSSGTAQFVHQIVVQSRSSFIKAGDSGSLLVTNDTNNYPVGLLFAGNNTGTFAVANNIGDVLTAFSGLGYQISIDGK
jgi:hypothetical protein